MNLIGCGCRRVKIGSVSDIGFMPCIGYSKSIYRGGRFRQYRQLPVSGNSASAIKFICYVPQNLITNPIFI
ncbi:hypothetical protein l11_07110 [Neisseria weaveri LMG 5135]|nr:hypothetical protein l11_07110 [Neisseria weaveri LMG 5135]